MDSSRIAVADRVDVKSVLGTLGIRKSLFYGRYTKDCQITPSKVGRRAYITGAEFELLQAYHLARASGKEALAEFLGKLSTPEEGQLSSKEPGLDNFLALSRNFLLSTIYQKLSARLSLLEQYAAKPYARLSNQELSQVLELSPNTLYGNKEYCRLGFVFRRDRQGWQVLIPVK